MPEPLTMGAAWRWLALMERTYGPDVPLWLADAAEASARRVRLGALLLTLDGGTPAVLLLGQSLPLAGPGEPHDPEAPPW